jgi:hypothetical protein
MKERLIKIFFDTIPVIFGVLIALFISGLKQDRDDSRYLNRVFSSIKSELKDNRGDIKDVMIKQNRLLDTVNYYQDYNSLTVKDIILKANGLQSVSLQNNSWKSLLQFKIDLIDYELISKLSAIEGSSDMLALKMEKFLEFLFENMDSKDPKHKKRMIVHINNVLNSEGRLLKLHDELLNDSLGDRFNVKQK